MSMETDLVDLVAPLLAGGLWPDIADQNTDLPYGTYMQVGGPTVDPIDGSAPGLWGARIQIDVWSRPVKKRMKRCVRLKRHCGQAHSMRVRLERSAPITTKSRRYVAPCRISRFGGTPDNSGIALGSGRCSGFIVSGRSGRVCRDCPARAQPLAHGRFFVSERAPSCLTALRQEPSSMSRRLSRQ